MKQIPFITCFLLLLASTAHAVEIERFYKQLDTELEKKALYEEEFEKELAQKRKQHTADLYTYHLNLFNAYCYNNSDSAFYHINQCEKIARQQNNESNLFKSQVNKAIYFSAVGLFTEAYKMMENVSLENKSKQQRLLYYQWEFYYYQHLINYIGKAPLSSNNYTQLMIEAGDSVCALSSEKSKTYYYTVCKLIYKKAKIDNSIKQELMQWMHNHEPNTREYALNALTLSMIFDNEGNKEEQRRYLSLSAIADIRTANHEVYSIQSLALICFRDGDLERAQRYIKSCIDDAQIYGNRIRAIEISNAQDIIHKAYSEKIRSQQNLLLILLSIVTLSVIVLIIFMRYTVRQKRLIHEQNEALLSQIELVKQTQQELTQVNKQLHEANVIKEEYIGHFLKMCSEYVNKMDEFRKYVNRKIKVGQIDDLLRNTSTNQSIEAEQKILFAKFDAAFIHLYPNFITNFNLLLKPEERVLPTKDEFLTNEMRICALIRLGIKDSSQIASFTGYSVNTIYTYRTKVRNKAINHHDFENQIMQIGLN